MATLLGDAVPVLALAVLLVVAFWHLPDYLEAAFGVGAGLACVATATSSWPAAYDAIARMLPVAVFLVAILAVAGGCADLGLFRAIGERIGRPGTSPRRFLALAFVAAVAVTAVLSLDATVVLLPLVVLAAAASAGVIPRPALSACVRLANSSSLLLPVSNLTALLAMRQIPLSFTRYALVMTPAWAGVIAVEYVAHRVAYRGDLRRPAARPAVVAEPTPLPAYPLAVVCLMLVGFAVSSALGVGAAWGAAWVASAAAVVLLAPAVARGHSTLAGAVRFSHPGFAVFVLGLAVVVDALTRGFLGDLVRHLLPTRATGLLPLLALAAIATVLANVVNNLPATLLLTPLVAPLGVEAVLATLVGLNVGSSLTWTGSLANLLWRRTLAGAGVRVGHREFHRISAPTVPVAVVVGVLLVHLSAGALL